MLESHLSRLSSIQDEDTFVQPHYREAYRLAIDALVSSGQDAYREVLKAERVGSFLSEDELLFIARSTEQPAVGNHVGEVDGSPDSPPSSGTYWPTRTDVETPNLELGWPDIIHESIQTNVELLFHPPRLNSPTIKEVIRKHIQDAQEVIAIAMDVFTDVDIFREIVDASMRGVLVYILLDHSQFKSFLTMAESQDIQIRKLRNMRVRTVKGLDYLCRTGAKFHGNMEQRFLLVDCKTVFFGSYSFMWSYEKINLSMIQVITGHLVASYDEEFRTLYARSTAPPELAPLDNPVGETTRLSGKVETCGPQTFNRKYQLRHTLNTVYKQTCERQGFGSHMAGIDEQLPDYDQRSHEQRMHQRPCDYTSATDATSFLKRHSYAGERQEVTYIPPHTRFGASNWNVAENRGGNRHHIPGGFNDPQHRAPPFDNIHRNSNIRQTYHGNGAHLMSSQQNRPSLEQMSKSIMRDKRVESYLSNSGAPIMENHEYMDQFDVPDNKPALLLHSRLRSSIVFTSAIPEQPEINGYTDVSSKSVRRSDQYGLAPSQYVQSPPSMRCHQPEAVDYKAMHENFILKRRSLQIIDPLPSGNCSSGRENFYASLGRNGRRTAYKDQDTLQEDAFKRHSVAGGGREPSSHMYGVLMREREERNTAKENMGSRVFEDNLSGDPRSISNVSSPKMHSDFKGTAESKPSSESTCQEPPSRTSAATLLELRDKERARPSGIGSPQFFKRKIKSLLNISEKKETSPKSKGRLLLKVGEGSSDTLVSEDEEQGGDGERKERSDTASPARTTGSPGRLRSHGPNGVGRSSAPRFNTEEVGPRSGAGHDLPKPPSQPSSDHGIRSSVTARELRRRDQYGDSRLYSRYDSSNGPEKRPSGYSQRNESRTSSPANDSHRGSTSAKKDYSDKTNHDTDLNTHSCHDNKLGRLFQRVGNLLHKKT